MLLGTWSTWHTLIYTKQAHFWQVLTRSRRYMPMQAKVRMASQCHKPQDPQMWS